MFNYGDLFEYNLDYDIISLKKLAYSILVLFNTCQQERWKDNMKAIKILLFYSKWTLVLSLFYGAHNSAMSILVIASLSIKV